MAALTANDPTFQPGFEDADTSITAGIGLYGYYGSVDATISPTHHPARLRRPKRHRSSWSTATTTPTRRAEGARALVDHLRAVSSNPFVYAELPGAQHSFDLFHSVRFETVIDAIEAFAAWVRSPHQPVHQPGHAQASTT